jgi:hypothetical protein
LFGLPFLLALSARRLQRSVRGLAAVEFRSLPW